MLTTAQYNSLPPLAQQIVDFDRAIRAHKAKPVADLKFYRDLTKRRGELVKAADKAWGVPLHGGGSSAR